MTSEQLTLDAQPDVDVPGRGTPTDQWRRACAMNPGLRAAFADTARQLLDQGRRATANVVAEELRSRFYTVGDEHRFNNTWRSVAAAELRDTNPSLARDMRTRRDRRG